MQTEKQNSGLNNIAPAKPYKLQLEEQKDNLLTELVTFKEMKMKVKPMSRQFYDLDAKIKSLIMRVSALNIKINSLP